MIYVDTSGQAEMESYNEQEPVTKWAEAEHGSKKSGMLKAGIDRIISQ